jgi:RhtB (resistance to homoserine/threonine) family protein
MEENLSVLGITNLGLFILAGVLLNLTPGPDFAYIVARSVQFGWRAGMVAALGICVGCFVHIAAAAVGLSALIATSSLAFGMLKWAGALYLAYVGISMVRARASDAGPPLATNSAQSARSARIFMQGFLTNALNPKVAIFFLALLPQFIRADAPSKLLAFLALGLTFTLTGTLWNLTVAWFAGRLMAAGIWSRSRLWFERALGAMLIAFGARLILIEKP